MPPERRKKYSKEAHTFSVRRACALFLSLVEQKNDFCPDSDRIRTQEGV